MHEFDAAVAPRTPERFAHLRTRMQARRAELDRVLESSPDDRAAMLELGRLDVALRWIRAGHYGACSICSDELPASQLERDPTDMVCTDCHEGNARSRRRLVRDVDPRPLSLVDGPEALTRGFVRARALCRG
jgi:hypothetical protein